MSTTPAARCATPAPLSRRTWTHAAHARERSASRADPKPTHHIRVRIAQPSARRVRKSAMGHAVQSAPADLAMLGPGSSAPHRSVLGLASARDARERASRRPMPSRYLELATHAPRSARQSARRWARKFPALLHRSASVTHPVPIEAAPAQNVTRSRVCRSARLSPRHWCSRVRKSGWCRGLDPVSCAIISEMVRGAADRRSSPSAHEAAGQGPGCRP
jgi:hypothetical protein